MQFLVALAMFASAAAPKIAPVKAQIKALSADPSAAVGMKMSPVLARALVMPEFRLKLQSQLSPKLSAQLGALADVAQNDQTVAMAAWSNLFEDAPGSKKKALKQLEEEKERIGKLQDMLFASREQSLLVVIQAMDTAGKDGVIKHVMTGINPAGVQVSAFKKPTAEEAAHDFLWRIKPKVPAKGIVGVFNRSHYEDILVPTVFKLLPEAELADRVRLIKEFEAELRKQGVTIIKLFLDISKDTQKQRLQDRLDDPDKNWKFDMGDLKMRKLWPKFMRTYRGILESSPAGWLQIPSNNKWFRNWLAARVLRETLENMNLKYPKPPEGLEDVVIE